jgi:hypothetical protein
MRARAIAVLLSLTVAGYVAADDVTTLLYFQDSSHEKLIVEFQIDEGVPTKASECHSEAECKDRYWLERNVGPRAPILVQDVEVKKEARLGFPLLVLCLKKKEIPTSFKNLQVVLAGMIDHKNEPIPWVILPVKPQLVQDEFSDVPSLTYQSLDAKPFTGVDLTTIKVTGTDKKDFDRPFTMRVKKISEVGERGLLHTIELDPKSVPRGRTLKTKLTGIERDDADDLSASTSVTRADFPKGRDDATYYMNLGVETNSVSGDKAYKYDMLIAPKFGKDTLFEHGPKLDVNVGNKTSKSPNRAALGWDFRWWLVKAPSVILSHDITVTPLYQADRRFVNRDAQVDGQYEPFFRGFSDTLQEKRAKAKHDGGVPLKIKWGYRVSPTIGIEAGWHLQNKSADVEGNAFQRARGTLGLMVERETVRSQTVNLTVKGTFRRLFSDEASVDDKDAVTQTARSDQSFLRADLAYNFGALALTLTHQNGREPPAYSSTHSTSLGVTLKF